MENEFDNELEIIEPLFSRLQDAIYEKKDALEEAKDRRKEFLKPILSVYGWEIGGRYFIEDVQGSRGAFVKVTVGWSSRGYRDSEDVEIPRWVLVSDDPVASAKLEVQQIQEKLKAEEKRQTEAEIERLKKKLSN